MRTLRLACLTLTLLATCACRTSKETLPAGQGDLIATRAKRDGLWEVRSTDGVVGFVARYVEESKSGRTYFVVRNSNQQDLGLVDALGRAWRYRPHAEEPEWLSTGTVLQGAAAILELDQRAELVEVDAGAAHRP